MSATTSTRPARAERRAAQAAGARNASPAARRPPIETEPAGGGLHAWHLFAIGGLAAASVGALAVRTTTPANVVFVCLGILTASAAGFAMFSMLWPLVRPERAVGPEVVGGRTRAALEREKTLVLRAIKDVEFDRAMGKISEPDSREMLDRLRGRALRLIRQLDTGAAGYREMIDRELASRLRSHGLRVEEAQPARELEPVAAGERSAQPVNEEPLAVATVCPGCGCPNDADARFCKQCGTKLTVPA